MKTTKKEQFLLNQGRKQETIDFCKDLKVPNNRFVWFCERIEKEGFDIKSSNFKEQIKKTLKLLNRTNIFNDSDSLKELIYAADKFVETDENESSRILHKFKNGHYIINLSKKELFLEGEEMSNCVGGMTINKKISILALKDKKNKTLVHFQVNNLGFLEQHYSKANSTVNLERWRYINEFFEIYKDKNFYEKISSIDLDINYRVKNESYNSLPVIEYFIPTMVTNSIFNSEEVKVNKVHYIKDFVNTNKINNNKKEQYLNKDGVVSFLNDFKKYINQSIEEVLEFINISDKNYYNLNDFMIQKIFNIKPPKLNEKISKITNEYQSKMIIDYQEERMEGVEPIRYQEERVEAVPMRNTYRHQQGVVEETLVALTTEEPMQQPMQPEREYINAEVVNEGYLQSFVEHEEEKVCEAFEESESVLRVDLNENYTSLPENNNII